MKVLKLLSDYVDKKEPTLIGNNKGRYRNLQDEVLKVSPKPAKSLESQRESARKEINQFTDLNLNYELIKEGRAYTKIKFTFDYKPESVEAQKPKTITATKEESHFVEDHTQSDFADGSSPFEQTLVGWGIRAKKVVEIEETYSLDAISKSIDETIKAESENKIKSTKASFFLGVLENKQKSGDEMFDREQVNVQKQQQKEQYHIP